MSYFNLGFVIAALSLLLLAAVAGKLTQWKSWTGILVDDRGRYSLNRLQLVQWTTLILATFVALFFGARGTGIPLELLGLLGISVSTAVLAGAVKSGKDTTDAVVQKGGNFYIAPGTIGPAGKPWRLAPKDALVRAGNQNPAVEPIPPHFSQVVLEEEGQFADKVINVTKFQNFVFTAVLAVWYVVEVLDLAQPGYPDLPERITWLLGISHAGYIGGKMPAKD